MYAAAVEEEEVRSGQVPARSAVLLFQDVSTIEFPMSLQDLEQYKDRENWYLPKFSANDAPDWNPGRFVRSRQLAPGLREVRSPAGVLCWQCGVVALHP